MSSSVPRPPPIGCRDPAGFGGFTVRQRFPQVIATVRARATPELRDDARLDELLADVVQGRAIRATHFADGSALWRAYLDSLQGRSWAELAFFETEFCFYHAINSLAGTFESGLDVFAATKGEALEAAVPGLERWLDNGGPAVSLRELVRRATIGNLADLSQLAKKSSLDDALALLVDDSRDLCKALVARGSVVHLLLDNVGAELCADLVLVDRLLATTARHVVLHAKPWPMFVSDALVTDVLQTLARFCASHVTERVRGIGIRLRDAQREGRLSIETHAAWGEPRHFVDFPSDLLPRLCAATVVVAKGDLNYRRFLEDRAWDADAALSVANSSPFSAYALRVLKSEALAGVPSETIRAVTSVDPQYRIDGRHAIVQHLPSTTQ